MDTLIKFSFQELELLIEVMERNRVNSDKENKLRHDLRSIRENAEIKKNNYIDDMDKKPNEEVKFISSNPTSAEHIK